MKLNTIGSKYFNCLGQDHHGELDEDTVTGDVPHAQVPGTEPDPSLQAVHGGGVQTAADKLNFDPSKEAHRAAAGGVTGFCVTGTAVALAVSLGSNLAPGEAVLFSVFSALGGGVVGALVGGVSNCCEPTPASTDTAVPRARQ